MPQIDLITFFNLLFSLFLFFSLVYFFDVKIFSVYTNFAIGNETHNISTKYENPSFVFSLILKLTNVLSDSKIWVEKFYRPQHHDIKFSTHDRANNWKVNNVFTKKTFVEFKNWINSHSPSKRILIWFLYFWVVLEVCAVLFTFLVNGSALLYRGGLACVMVVYPILLSAVSSLGIISEIIYMIIMCIYYIEYATLHILLHLLQQLVPLLVIVIGSALAVAFITLSERKGLAGVQRRQGPAVVGPFGILQPIADAAKLLVKQGVSLKLINKLLYQLAPLVAFSIPFPLVFLFPSTSYFQWLTGALREVGLLVLLSFMTIKVFSVIFAGWASNSKYPLLGCIRSVAQMVSYELSFGISLVGVSARTGSFSMNEIQSHQAKYGWNIFHMPILAVNNFIALLAEANRTPFDNLESEAELVSGYNTEYSSWSFAAYFLAEYLMLFIFANVYIVCFLGGNGLYWDTSHLFSHMPYFTNNIYELVEECINRSRSHAVFEDFLFPYYLYFTFIPKIFWLFFTASLYILWSFLVMCFSASTLKVICILLIIVVLRGVLPRTRFDQLMIFGWKFMLPLSFMDLITIIIAKLF